MKALSEMSQVELIALIMTQNDTIVSLTTKLQDLRAIAYPVEDEDYIDPVLGKAAWQGEQERGS